MDCLKARSTKVDLPMESFFDDTTIYGSSWSEVWEDTLEAIRLITEEGIMINVKKCKFLVTRLELLGVVVYSSGMQIGPKSMKAWLSL